MAHNPFCKQRTIKPRKHRMLKDGRVQLSNRSELRLEAYERAKGRCEKERDGKRCNRYAPLQGVAHVRGQLCHKEHGIRRNDTLDSVLWGCPECHNQEHNPKAVPRRMGRKMSKPGAKKYLLSLTCVCGRPKQEHASQLRPLCIDCTLKISPQSHLNLSELRGDEWLQAFANAEMEILRYETTHGVV